ncbi:ADP-ribosylglycohydrolase family protein [Massilia sp. PAMC28688]|uniref:ADP-ribosylglycohydrolase family protein n=1 Tax=Massilia sp. PAMC28688 TaxID=2861283 RepID=UPI001C633FBF|nr:ADP-ribosylglycohydrolase family protein [Massilia sp. PAMC28688]QYF96157.1 ADP-ribosylglycohydrolase family protein [Massilia sp. PAMC28688]
MTEQGRYRGALLGLACGDAIGTTVEFKPRGSFPEVVDMVGGGPFKLQPGQWTDDTSMALCLAHSLLERGGFDPADQMERYCNWRNNGYMSSTGTCFDIGNTTAAALRRYESTRDPFAGSDDPSTAGNGALMRLAPVAMFYADDEAVLLRHAAESTRVTHAAVEAIECSKLFALQLRAALHGRTKADVMQPVLPEQLSAKVQPLATGAYVDKTEEQIKGSGYAVESLEAALWCFWRTNSFKEAVLLAANLGDDADTTAAICGQLCGAYYGVQDIPAPWIERLAMRDDIILLADRLASERPASEI